MNVEVQIVKDIPKEQIEKFEDRVVYGFAVETREYTKQDKVFPYKSGTLERSEIAAPIVGSKLNYGLTAGVDYAVAVYKLDNAHWTNSNTKPHWYMTTLKTKEKTIQNNAVASALREVK